MTAGLIFKLFLCAVVIGIGVSMYRNEIATGKRHKPYTLREIYTIGGFVNEGIFLESQVNHNSRFRHLETLDILIAKSIPESLEKQRLKELRHAIAIQHGETQIERNQIIYERKISDLQVENSILTSKNELQKEEIIKLKREIRKLRSYQKHNRRL